MERACGTVRTAEEAMQRDRLILYLALPLTSWRPWEVNSTLWAQFITLRSGRDAP